MCLAVFVCRTFWKAQKWQLCCPGMRSSPSTMSIHVSPTFVGVGISTDSSHESWDLSMLVPNNTKKSRLIEFSHKKCVYGNDSNFFVFQYYGKRFSGFCCLFLKRSFPGSFEFWDGLERCVAKYTKNFENQKSGIAMLMGTRPGSPKWQKTPEMNELQLAKYFLKFWASNFEKQKS